MMYGYYGNTILAGFIIILFLIGIVWFIVWITKDTTTTYTHKDNKLSKTAMDILNERYARGDISKEEYDLKQRDIRLSKND